MSPRAWLARRDTAVFVGLESTTWRARATARRDEDGPSRQRAGAVALVAILAAVASVAVYREVLDSYFWNDDFVWMYLLRDRSLAEVLFTPIGGHTLVARNALFALVLAAFGLDPRPYFATVLATHAVNVLLVCRLVWLLTGNVALAGLGALAWGTCPAASETLAWYSVYGQIAALTCLLAMFCHIARRARASGRLTARDLVVAGAWLGLASVFFGSAIAVAIVFPFTVALLFPGMLAIPGARRGVLTLSAFVLFVHGALLLLASRVYSVPSVHADALRWLIHNPGVACATFVHLVRVGVTSLMLGAWWSTADGSHVVSWIVLVVVCIAWPGTLRIASHLARGRILAFTLLALSSYALVALSRGPMAGFFHTTATQLGATLRYHYTAQAFLVVAFGVALDVLGSQLRPWARAALAAVPACVLVAGHVLRIVPIDVHADSRSEVAHAMKTLRARTAAAPAGEVVYVDNEPLAAFGWMPNIPVPLPGLAALFVIVSPSGEIDGRRVRFVEHNPVVYRQFIARSDSRLAALLILDEPGARVQPSSR